MVTTELKDPLSQFFKDHLMMIAGIIKPAEEKTPPSFLFLYSQPLLASDEKEAA